MADIPFLGCKISLISKCDIRYEGILYCVDAKESTIALSKVRSYGTETRGDPSRFVAPKNDVYDIIIFRASDVKDLRVDAPEPPGLSDPAIISAHHSYQGQPPSSSTSLSNNTNSSSSSNNKSNATATNASSTISTGLPLNTNGSLPTSGPSNHQNKQQQQHQKPLLPFLPTGSAKDKQPNQHQAQFETINYSAAVANAHRRDANQKRLDEPKKQAHSSNREARNERRSSDKREDRRESQRRGDDRREGSRRGDDRRQDRRDDRRDDGRRSDGRANNMRISRGGYDNHRNQGNQNMRYNNSNNYNGANYNSRRGPNRENSKGAPMYRRGPMQGDRRGRSDDRTGAPRGPRKSAPLKFEGEYDFDEANKLFLELEGKFKNLKLKKDENNEAESSGDGANSKSPVDHSESGSNYDSEDQSNKDVDAKDEFGESVTGEFYDKTKSFFDNISCEASERSQGKVNKPDWRKERQLNAETFGVSSSYRRGGYRGRVYGNNGYHRR